MKNMTFKELKIKDSTCKFVRLDILQEKVIEILNRKP